MNIEYLSMLLLCCLVINGLHYDDYVVAHGLTSQRKFAKVPCLRVIQQFNTNLSNNSHIFDNVYVLKNHQLRGATEHMFIFPMVTKYKAWDIVHLVDIQLGL